MTNVDNRATGSVETQSAAVGNQQTDDSHKSTGASSKAGNSALPSPAARSSKDADPKDVNVGASTSGIVTNAAKRGESSKKATTPQNSGKGKGSPGSKAKGSNGNVRNLERPEGGRPAKQAAHQSSPAPQGKLWKGKSADQQLNSQIAQAMCEYRDTAWYEKAVKLGFKNKAALDKFNAAVAAKADSIDPRYAPVCTTCGHSDLILCDCLITAKANAVADDDAVITIPDGAPNFRYEWNWVGRIKRMFCRPNFDSAADYNTNIGWMDNEVLLGQDMLWSSLLSYLRMNANTSYTLNGAFDRKQKLAHMKKLALRYFQEINVPQRDRLNPLFVNKVHHTVQVACDMPDDDFLFREVEMKRNITSFINARALWGWRYQIIVAAACLSPVFLSTLVNASQRIHQWIYVRLFMTNVRILAYGSVLAVKSTVQIGLDTAPVIAGNIYNGLVKPCFITIQQLLCNIARTTLSTVSSIDISKRLPSRTILTGVSSIVSSTEWPQGLLSTTLRSTTSAI